MRSLGTTSWPLYLQVFLLTASVTAVPSAVILHNADALQIIPSVPLPQQTGESANGSSRNAQPIDVKMCGRSILMESGRQDEANTSAASLTKPPCTIECVPKSGLMLDYQTCLTVAQEFERAHHSYYTYDLTPGDELLPNDIHVPWKFTNRGCEFKLDFISDDPSYEMLVQPQEISELASELVNRCVGPDGEKGDGGTVVVHDPEGSSAILTFLIGAPSTKSSPQGPYLGLSKGYFDSTATQSVAGHDMSRPNDFSLALPTATEGSSVKEQLSARSLLEKPTEADLPPSDCLRPSPHSQLEYTACREAIGMYALKVKDHLMEQFGKHEVTS